MSLPRFDYKILEDGEIEIFIAGREKLNAERKVIDNFTQKRFRIESKEIMKLDKFLKDIAFEWCKKFNCRLDAPVCY